MKTFVLIVIVLIVILIAFSVSSGFRMHKEEIAKADALPKVETEKEKPEIDFDGHYALDVKTTTATWTGKKKILKEWIDYGTIAVKGGEIEIKNSTSDWSGTSGNIMFDMSTIKSTGTGGKATASPVLDKHLKSADFFDVEKYPEAKFLLKKVTKNTKGGYDLLGDLAIKGVTKPVVLASINELDVIEGSQGKAIEAKGTVTFNRADFDVKYGSDSFFKNLGDGIIENEVRLDLRLLALKK